MQVHSSSVWHQGRRAALHTSSRSSVLEHINCVPDKNACRCSPVLVCGRTGAFWRVISEYGAAKLFTAPSALRSIRVEDPLGERMKPYNLSSLKTVFLVGERMDIATCRWFSGKMEEVFKAANQTTAPLVVDHWWQSETGWPMTCIMTGEPLKPEDYAPYRYSLPPNVHCSLGAQEYSSGTFSRGKGEAVYRAPEVCLRKSHSLLVPRVTS